MDRYLFVTDLFCVENPAKIRFVWCPTFGAFFARPIQEAQPETICISDVSLPGKRSTQSEARGFFRVHKCARLIVVKLETSLDLFKYCFVSHLLIFSEILNDADDLSFINKTLRNLTQGIFSLLFACQKMCPIR